MQFPRSTRRGMSPAVIVVVLVVVAAAAYLGWGMVVRSRQHEADKIIRGGQIGNRLAVKIVQAPDKLAVNKEAVCEVEVKNIGPVPVVASSSAPVHFTVGCYIVKDVKDNGSFLASVDLPKDIAPNEAVPVKVSFTPTAPLPSGFLVARAFGTRTFEGKPQGDWATEPASQKVTVSTGPDAVPATK